MIRAQLLVFAKPPRIGISKTRLAAELGVSEARRIANFLLNRTLKTAHTGPWKTTLYVSPDNEAHLPRGAFANPRYSLRPQGPGNLTTRLERGLTGASNGPVLFVGTDAPAMTTLHLHAAIQSLKTNDAVFGPANDGGFWLFGLNKYHKTRSPFQNVRWSSPHALMDVRKNLPQPDRVAMLPTLIDIDDRNDWIEWTKTQSRN